MRLNYDIVDDGLLSLLNAMRMKKIKDGPALWQNRFCADDTCLATRKWLTDKNVVESTIAKTLLAMHTQLRDGTAVCTIHNMAGFAIGFPIPAPKYQDELPSRRGCFIAAIKAVHRFSDKK